MYRPSPEPLSSGRFRDVILAEHDTLRRLIAQTVEVANSSVAGELDELRAAARQLYVTLEEHMSFEDQMLPVQNGKLIASLIPGARLELLDGVGHMFWWERPSRSAELFREHASTAVVSE